MATIPGTSGDDTLDGTSGADRFDLEAGGDDTAFGRKGFDNFFFGAEFTAADHVDGGQSGDTVWLDGDYRHRLVLGADTLHDVETILVLAGYSYNLATDDANVGAGTTLRADGDGLSIADRLKFDGSAETDGDFVLAGGAGDDVLVGGAQGDLFQGSPGGDVARGGGGDDYFGLDLGMDAGDRIDGGAGVDDTVLIEGWSGSPLALTGKTFRNIDTFRIDAGAGVAGAISVGDGVTAAGAAMTVTWESFGAGDFAFDGSAETDGLFVLNSEDGADTLEGGRQDDTIRPAAGNDVLIGGGGADFMIGGAGADRFVYETTEDSSRHHRDFIYDLAAEDLIDLSGIDADETAGGDQAFTLVSAFSHAAGEAVLAYQPGSYRTLLSLDVDGDGKADTVVELNGDNSGYGNFVL